VVHARNDRAEPGADLLRFERLAIDVARLCWPAPAQAARRQSILMWEGRVGQYVEQNLSDPDLSAESIAQRFGVSSRFVHINPRAQPEAE
jgi:hypothetical protein